MAGESLWDNQMIRTLCVFYRPIGCADEASTDEEQGEKILYYYPEASLSKQLSRVTMLEGLIEFTAKFSKAPIETAMMENQTWAFVQCEPELWIVAAVDNDSGVAEAASTSFEDSQSDRGQQQNQHHRPNGMCFFDALMKMYRVFCLLRGNLVNVIRGKNGSGMEHVQKVQDERKRTRKLKIKLRQEHLDLANVTRRAAEQLSPSEGEGESEGEQLGIRGDGVSLEDTQRTVDETLAQIAAAEERLAALLDESTTYPPRLARAMLISFFSWYLPTNELNNPCAFHSASGVHFCPVGHPAFQYLLRVRQAAEDISRGILRGCLLLHDGGVAWSDFDDETTFTIYEFLRLCEGDHVRSSLQRHLNTQARSGGPSSGGAAPHSGSSGLGGLAARMKRSSVSSPSHGSGQLRSSASSASASSASVEGEDLAQGEAEWARRLLAAKGFVTGSNPVWGAAGLEDAVTLQGSDSDEAGGGGGGGASASPTSSATATSSAGNAFLGADCVTARNIWCPRIFACDSRVARRGGASTAKRRASGHGLVKGDLALSAGVCQCLGRAVVYRQGLFFLVMLFPDWSDEEGGPPFAMDHIDKAMRRQDEASFSSSSSTGVPPTGSWTRRVGESSLLNLCASLERGLSAELDLLDRSVGLEARCIDAASGALGAGAGAGAGVAPSRASVETPPSSSSSSSSPQGKKRQKVLPDTVRLLYFNACNRALKAGSFLRKSDLSPLLLGPTTPPFPRSPSLSLALGRVSHHFPVPSALLSSFVEPAVLRAMNDLRETLSSRSREGGGVTESCLRVSTQQRGGVWVVGRRFGGRFLLAVVEKCSTLNEVYDAFEVVCSEVYSQIVIS